MRVGVLALLSALLVGAGVWAEPNRAAQPSDADATLRADVERLKTEVQSLREELRLLGELLRQRLTQPQPAPPRPVKVSVGDNPTLGRADAPLTLIEFSDYQCPFCRQFFDATLPALKKDYVETGKLRYVFRDFPIDQLHPLARRAAEAAHCAGDQDKYWVMHDLLFQHQDALQPDDLARYATQLRLDMNAFTTCLDSGKHRATVQNNFRDGTAAGVRGTPAFVLGKSRADNAVEAMLVTGARPLSEFRDELERLAGEP